MLCEKLVPTMLTLHVPNPDEEKKLRQVFIFTLLCGAPIGLMKALKAFVKPFEAPERTVKIKFILTFISMQLSEMHGTVSVNVNVLSTLGLLI